MPYASDGRRLFFYFSGPPASLNLTRIHIDLVTLLASTTGLPRSRFVTVINEAVQLAGLAATRVSVDITPSATANQPAPDVAAAAVTSASLATRVIGGASLLSVQVLCSDGSAAAELALCPDAINGQPKTPSSGDALSTPGVIGVVIGSVAFAAIVGFVAFRMVQRSNAKIQPVPTAAAAITFDPNAPSAAAPAPALSPTAAATDFEVATAKVQAAAGLAPATVEMQPSTPQRAGAAPAPAPDVAVCLLHPNCPETGGSHVRLL
jgi:hypothetical protein